MNLYLILGVAVGAGLLSGVLTSRAIRALFGEGDPQRAHLLRMLPSWLVGLAVYSVVTETYRPIFSAIWWEEAILGGDLIPVVLFSVLMAGATTYLWGPQGTRRTR